MDGRISSVVARQKNAHFRGHAVVEMLGRRPRFLIGALNRMICEAVTSCSRAAAFSITVGQTSSGMRPRIFQR